MPRYLLLLLLYMPFAAKAQPGILQFKLSKPTGIFTFLQALNNEANISATYKAYIQTHAMEQDTAMLSQLGRAFGSLQLYSTYTFDTDLPARQKLRSTYDLIKMAAVQANDNADFMARIAGILPNSTWLQLGEIFTQASPYYDKIIWKEYHPAISRQLDSMNKYAHYANKAFEAINRFYGSTWTAGMPFTVAIYPIPGDKGGTTATAHSHCLVIGVLTGEKKYGDRMGIVMHEIAHVLYEEQPIALQQQLDRAFQNNKSIYSPFASSYLNEGLATACGNGWAYKYINGTADTTDWYNDEYIDEYAHALYPLTEQYINTGKTIDSSYIAAAIGLFAKALPQAPYNYSTLLNKMSFYTDAGSHEQFQRIASLRERHFRSSSVYSSYPVADAQSLEMMRTGNETQLCLVYTHHEENLKELKAIFPQLENVSGKKEQIISFTDARQRAVIIVLVKDESRIEQALQKMQQIKQFNPAVLAVDIE